VQVLVLKRDMIIRQFSVACREGTELFLQGSVIARRLAHNGESSSPICEPLQPSSFCWSQSVVVLHPTGMYWLIRLGDAEIEMVVRQQTTIVWRPRCGRSKRSCS